MISDALFRLIGDGDRAAGGAIPLPVAFTAVVNELLDHGNASFGRLNRLVSDVLHYKEERIMAAAWRSWEQFTRDILTCLEDMNLVKEDAISGWGLTEEFVPGYTFHIPNTDIGFTGRKKEDRDRRNQNEALYLSLMGALKEVQEQPMVVLERSPLVYPFIRDNLQNAELLLKNSVEALERELGLGEIKPPTRYELRSPRRPHERHRRIRKGMTAFFREEFWQKYAQPDVWYDMKDAALKWQELNPDQPPINHGDLHGSMRKVARELVESGFLEMQVAPGEHGARKHIYRIRKPVPAGYGSNASIVPVESHPKDHSRYKERPATSFVEEAENLKRSGDWEVILTTSQRQDAANLAWRINTARLKAFGPAHSFQAYSKKQDDGDYQVHARYVGEHNGQSLSHIWVGCAASACGCR